MDLQKEKYIIVEVLPTARDPEKGFIAQLSALKLQGITLEDRFDYRVEDHLIENEEIKRMIQYDKKNFTYVNNIYFIIEKFKQWAKDYPLILIEKEYTNAYLEGLTNKKELVYPYLEIEYNEKSFDQMIKKYHLEPSNYIVDLVYEAIIYEGNNKKKES